MDRFDGPAQPSSNKTSSNKNLINVPTTIPLSLAPPGPLRRYWTSPLIMQVQRELRCLQWEWAYTCQVLQSMRTCTCGLPIPEGRVRLGYRVCVSCSTEARWSALHVVYHKTGNTIEVVKDPELAALATAMSARSGFGVLKGMTGRHRKPAGLLPAQTPVITTSPPPPDRVLKRTPPLSQWEVVGQECMSLLEESGLTAALLHMETALHSKRIWPAEGERLRGLLTALSSTSSPS